MMSFAPDGPILTLRFKSVDAATTFKAWLSGSGEQSYWEWCEAQGDDSPSINYHVPGGSIIDFKE